MTTSIHQSIPQSETLGSLLAEYGATQVRRKGNLWGGIIFIIFGLIGIGTGLIAAFTDTDTSVVGFCSGIGLLSIVGGAWAVRIHNQEQDMAVQIYRDGLVWQRNGRTIPMRWDEVLNLDVIASYNKQLRTAFYTYTLKDTAERKIQLNLTQGHFENAEQLSHVIQQEVISRQLARVLTRINAGESVQFGPLTVNQSGIEYGRKFLPWSQAAGALLGRGYFLVQAKDQTTNWARIDMVKVPNMLTVIALVNRMMEIGQR